MFNVSLYVHKGKKLETIQISFDIKMDKLWYIHPTDYYTAVKINELDTIIWINLKRQYRHFHRAQEKAQVIHCLGIHAYVIKFFLKQGNDKFKIQNTDYL